MEMKNLNAAIALVLGSVTLNAHAVTLTFSNATTAGVQGTDFNYTACTHNFEAGREFRFCDPNMNLGGGLPLNKDAMFGGETWSYNATGLMESVSGTGAVVPLGPTVIEYIDMGYVDPSADRDGATLGLQQNTVFFGGDFNFLAPLLGSEAVTAGAPHPNDIGVGVGTYSVTGANTFELFFPVLEAHWVEVHFMLGQDGDAGITFYGTTDGTNFSMWAEHTMTAAEDAMNACCAGWTTQWYMVGTIEGFAPPVPVPAAAWMLGSGLVGLVGVACRRRPA